MIFNEWPCNICLVSNKLPFDKQDFEYFIGYKVNKKIRPLCIFIPELSIHKRYFDKIKCMYFVIKDETFFDK